MGSFLRSVRERQRLSQDDVATLSAGGRWRLSRSALSAIERGRNLPSLEGLIALSRVLRVDPMEIIERAELGSTDSLAELPALSFDELDRAARTLFCDGDFRGALEHYDAMLELLLTDSTADALRDEREATVQLRRAAALRRCGTLLAARAAVERAIALSAGAPEVRAQSYTLLSTIYVQMDNLPLARDTAQRAVELAEPCSDKVKGRALINEGIVQLRAARYEDARAAFVRAREYVRLAGDDVHLPHVEGNIGTCWLRLGRPKQASQYITRAVKLSRKLGLAALEAVWLVDLGRVALQLEDEDQAERCAAAALRIATAGEQWLTIFRAEWLRHLVRSRHETEELTRKRMDQLSRLATRLGEHRSEEALEEYLEAAAAFEGSRRTE